MKSIPLTQMRALAVVRSAGGVRAAARELGIAHSAVSRHLTALQEWVGAQLFEGGGRAPLSLTPAGALLARAAADGLEGIQRAVHAVRTQRRGNSVAVVTTASFATRWLLPRLSDFSSANPAIDLSVLVNPRVANPAAEFADLAVRMGEGPWPDEGAEPLMDEWLYPVMSPDLWEQSGRSDDPQCLLKLKLLHDADPGSAWARWVEQHPVTELDLRAGRRFASSDLVLRAAAQGMGVALARHRFAEMDLETGVLVRPFASRVVRVPNAYWIVPAPNAVGRHAVRVVLKWLRAQASDEASRQPNLTTNTGL